MHLDELRIPYWRQYRYVPGRQFRADFGIPERKLLIEVQGGVFSRRAHGSITGVLKDNERLNQATLQGYRVLRFTPDEVMDGRAKETVAQCLKEGDHANVDSLPR